MLVSINFDRREVSQGVNMSAFEDVVGLQNENSERFICMAPFNFVTQIVSV